jgi:hypothetical protein
VQLLSTDQRVKAPAHAVLRNDLERGA